MGAAQALATASPRHPRAKDSWPGRDWAPKRACTQGPLLEQEPRGWAARGWFGPHHPVQPGAASTLWGCREDKEMGGELRNPGHLSS